MMTLAVFYQPTQHYHREVSSQVNLNQTGMQMPTYWLWSFFTADNSELSDDDTGSDSPVEATSPQRSKAVFHIVVCMDCTEL